MSKIEYIACMDLHKRLKEKINGNIFISIASDDTLFINLKTFRGLRYTYKFPHISYEIIGSEFINPDKIINMFLNDYKDYLQKIYFRR